MEETKSDYSSDGDTSNSMSDEKLEFEIKKHKDSKMKGNVPQRADSLLKSLDADQQADTVMATDEEQPRSSTMKDANEGEGRIIRGSDPEVDSEDRNESGVEYNSLLNCFKSLGDLDSPASTAQSRETALMDKYQLRRREELRNILSYGSEHESDEELDQDLMPLPRMPLAIRMFQDPQQDSEVLAPDGDYIDAIWPSPTPPKLTQPIQYRSGEGYGPEMFQFDWREFADPPTQECRRESFNQTNCGPTTLYIDPYGAFIAIWDRPFVEHIAVETNKYAKELTQRLHAAGDLHQSHILTDWRDTDADELYTMFAIMLWKLRLEELWYRTETGRNDEAMTYDRFCLLNSLLHFNDNACLDEAATHSQAKVYKIQPVIDHLNRKFSTLYKLDKNIAIDVSLNQWKARSQRCIIFEPEDSGIKSYEVWESETGYLWRFELQTEDEPQQSDTPISGPIPTLVLRLLQGLEHTGRTVWLDGYCSSPALARTLKVLGFDCAGTLRLDRQFVPEDLKTLDETDMLIGGIEGRTSGDVDVLVWRGLSRIGMISTYHEGVKSRENRSTPTLLREYVEYMSGVDKKDRILSAYPIELSERVWYKKFFRRLLNISVTNAHLLYASSTPRALGHGDFRKALVDKMLEVHGQRDVPSTPAVSISTKFVPGECLMPEVSVI